MNKKAVFMPMLSFFVLILLTYAYYEKVVKENYDQSRDLGRNQAEIIKAYDKGIEYGFNAETAVKYSSYAAINEFSNNGGVLKECNNLWKFNSNCNPDLEKNFINVFKNELLKYKYEVKEVKVENNFLIITLNDFNYNYNKGNFKLDYSLPITIKQGLFMDLNKLNEVKEKIRKCLEDGKDLNTCTNEKNEVQGGIVTFSIENNKEIIVYTNKLETKKPIFVFKIDKNNAEVRGVF